MIMMIMIMMIMIMMKNIMKLIPHVIDQEPVYDRSSEVTWNTKLNLHLLNHSSSHVLPCLTHLIVPL